MSGGKMKYKIGDRIVTWFSNEPDHKSTIIEIEPYRGKYPEYFNVTLRVTAPRTQHGWIELPEWEGKK